MARATVGTIAILLTSLVVGMTSVAADSPAEPVAQRATHTVTVPTQRVITIERDPAAPADRCNSVDFYKWNDVPGTVSATITYTYPPTGLEYTVTKADPFDDVYTGFNPHRIAPSGTHWIVASEGHTEGAGAGGMCEERRSEEERILSETGTAELTVEGPAEPPIDMEKCNEARADLKARNKAVSKLLGKLKNASSDSAKDQIREQLAKAKIKRAKAVQKVNKACT